MVTDLVIFATLRSGSHWLARSLYDHGLPLCKEYFTSDKDEFEFDFNRSRNTHTSSFGIKLSPSDLKQRQLTLDTILDDRQKFFICLDRHDVDAQAASLAGARKTGRWFNGTTQGIVQPTKRDYLFLYEEKLGLDRYCKNINVVKVYYEDLFNPITVPSIIYKWRSALDGRLQK